jgi:hypothetical protein
MGDDTEVERLERAARSDDIARLKVQRDNALIDMERFWKERDALLALLKDYEQWEADIILEQKCWKDEFVQLTPELYDRMIELQTERNRCFQLVGKPREQT